MIEETPTEQTPLKQNSKRFSRSASASSASGHRGQSRVEPAFPDERRFGNNSFQSSTTLSLSSDPRLISVHCRTTMDNTKTVLLKVGFDFFILCCVGFPILIFFVVGDPFKRGFFCDDESLMHPFHDSTITNWMLYIIGLALPVIVILITEFLRNRAKHSETQPLKVFNTDISYWVVQAYKSIGMFGFGAAVSQLLTDVGKYTIGRLRPHFFDVCRPMMPNNTTCADVVNHGRYITDFVCTSEKSSTRMLKEMRLSFPSGHSSFSMYTLVFCAIFLQSRMNWRGSKLLKHFFQFLLILLAWYTCLSRISDYKHHWSDVLAGGVLGATVAIVVSNFCTDLFAVYRKRSIMSLPQTRYELSANHAAPVNGSQ